MGRTLILSLHIVLGSLLAAPALAVNLGDLNVPASRIPEWYGFDESGYQAAKGWPEVDVTCSAAPCASGKAPFTSISSLSSCGAVTATDMGPMGCHIGRAPDHTALYLPAGTYQVAAGNALRFGRSNVVVRGAGRNATVLVRTTPHRDIVGGCSGNTGATLATMCSPSGTGATTSWNGGYAARARTVRVGDVSLFPPGSWILLRMSGSTACEYIDRPLNWGGDPDAFVHIAKVTATDPSRGEVTLDRGLRMDYNGAGCSGHTATVYRPIENVGIESMRLTSSTSVSRCNDSNTCIKFSPISLTHTADSWIVDTRVDRHYELWFLAIQSARIWVQGNDFANLDESISFNTEGLYLAEGAVDVVFENNTCTGSRVCQKLDNGASGTITAYNYMRQNQNTCERSYMNHGHYVRESLFEGNDVDCEVMMADSWWGRNGPRITAYRNRNVSNVCHANRDSFTVNEDGNSGWPAATDLNMIGNSAPQYLASPVQGNPPCAPSVNGSNDLSSLVEGNGIWLEKNAWRVPAGTFDHGSSNQRSCGTGAMDACPGTNHNTSSPHSSWSGNYPTSLYRTSAPSWWCQEACPWSPQGIGAFGDDFASGSICKLPAEIRATGGTCTPLAGGSPPPPPPASPPAAPVLLP